MTDKKACYAPMFKRNYKTNNFIPVDQCVNFNQIASSGNDPKLTKAMRYSQYVNAGSSIKNVMTISYKDYVARFGPLPDSFLTPTSTNPFFQTSYR